MEQFKSNINITSNIYIRDPHALEDHTLCDDKEFIEKVTGVKALQDFKIKSSTYHIKLNEFQKGILKNTKPCMHAKKSGESTHGLVFDRESRTYSVECRCEQKNCLYKKILGCNVIHRYIEPVYTEAEEEENIDLSWLNIDPDTIFEDKEQLEEEKKIIAVPKEDAIKIEDIIKDKHEYAPLNSEEAISGIIKSGIDTHILVNAAPGTGKTYTAIQRLIYILENIEEDDFDCILVICYTRAAVAEIKSRIEKGIAEETIPYQARNVFVCTFDSLATSYLISKGYESSKLAELNYNDRILCFNAEFDGADFEHFRYCIIDEIQDLVNDRALMALKIIEALKCGYLLLGDKCQAIYDYDCKGESSVNSTEFYKRLDECICSDSQKYELIGNKRQSETLNTVSETLRNALLSGDIKNIHTIFKNKLKAINVFEYKANALKQEYFDPDETTAILCRNNGQAEYMSHLLHKKGIPHTLLKKSDERVSIDRTISDVFWDYDSNYITKYEFVERLVLRKNYAFDEAEKYFDTICEFLSEDTYNIDCSKLLDALRMYKDIPDELLSSQNKKLVVSTIHKAKGREFDRVFLLDMDDAAFNKNDTEEERVLYVALTRPKNNICILQRGSKSNWYFRKGDNDIWGRLGKKQYFRYMFCRGIAVGTENNTDISSFAEGDLVSAICRQKYISEEIKPNDDLKLVRKGKIYSIIHKDTEIGKMSEKFSDDFLSFLSDLRQGYSARLPETIENLFVSSVISCVPYEKFDNVDIVFREKGLWLGVEVTGFGSARWEAAADE